MTDRGAGASSRLHKTLTWGTLAAVAAAGISIGWLGQSTRGSFDYVYAVAQPAGTAILCISALIRRVQYARWVVPLLLVSVMLNAVTKPQVAALTAAGVAAGAVAVIACAGRVKFTAPRVLSVCCTAIIVCCGAISGSLLLALRGD